LGKAIKGKEQTANGNLHSGDGRRKISEPEKNEPMYTQILSFAPVFDGLPYKAAGHFARQRMQLIVTACTASFKVGCIDPIPLRLYNNCLLWSESD
jgi:hypothetical protein